ncbi:hypothetical protein [Agrobacterium vitis]|uniref:hypothetical protein n=1 Tax=Agrobacterium vitis TaxID=373 RepID=UPI003D269D84
MTTPQTFDQTLFKICKIHAAWLPITNGFELGDYGIIDSGIFRKLGNVTRDFGLTFITKPGASSNVKFSSNGVAVTHVSGEAEAKLAGNADVTATLSISFEKTDSFYISGSLSLTRNTGHCRPVQEAPPHIRLADETLCHQLDLYRTDLHHNLFA